MGGKAAKQKATNGQPIGYWPLNGLGAETSFPNLYSGLGCFGGFGFPSFGSPFNYFGSGYGLGCGFDGLNCFNGISPLALPYSPFNAAPQTTGKLAMTYNGAKFNLKW